MRRPPFAFSLLIALFAVGCGGGGGSKTQTVSPPAHGSTAPVSGARFMGVTAGGPLITLPQATKDREMRLMTATGVTSVRQAFYWNVAEPKRGTFAWKTTDGFMRAAAQAHLDVLPVLVGTPAWATAPGARPFASPPRDPADYAAYVTAAVKRYGPSGTFWRANPSLRKDPVRAWQIWNEPNHLRYWNTQPFDAGYVRLAKAARAAVKATDPSALVVSAGFAERSWDLIAGMERAGAKGVFDVIAIHPYTFEPANVLRIVKLVRAALVKAGQGSVPLWATEVTWSSAKGKVTTPLGFETTEADQATRLTRAFTLLAANRQKLNLQRAYWESWMTPDADKGNTFDFSGLRELHFNGSVRKKPAFGAYRAFALRMRAAG